VGRYRPLKAILYFSIWVGCNRDDAPAIKPVASAPGGAASVGAVASTEARPPLDPRVEEQRLPVNLLVQQTSAYAAKVMADTDAAYLFTEGAAYHLVPEGNPAEIRVEDGFLATTTSSSIVYHSKGSLLRVPKRGGKSEPLAKVQGRPQNLTSFGEELAWNETPAKGTYVIQMLDTAGRAHRIHDGKGKIWSIVLGADQLVFLEVLGDAWRVGGVSRSGGVPRFAIDGEGHAPSALVASEKIYFYEWKTKEVRRISFSLSEEEVVARGLDCRQLAVAARVYCANEAGFFEISKQPNAHPHKIAAGANVTSLSVSATRLVWVSDFATGKLSVDMLPLLPTGAH